jgi:hypothetical protein
MDSDQGGQWLTYAEAGRRFGVSPEAARQLAKRRGWQRRTPNEPNETARILVPDDAYVRPRTPVNGVSPPSMPPTMNGLDRVVEAENVRGVELAISTLSAQLERERSRVDRAERLLDEERERGGKLEASLSDAIGAERIAAGEACALRAELDRRREWKLLRRLRWALRGDRR